MKKVLITGITGQDGSYLTEILLDKDYEVHGIIRKSSSFNTGRIDHLYSNKELLDKKLFLHYGDLVDTSSLNRLLERIEPDEIYNLACPASPIHYQRDPVQTTKTSVHGAINVLAAVVREV